ncbi:MAG: hypothetical protein R6T96_16855, partial [Longimicrobiales bacterium]
MSGRLRVPKAINEPVFDYTPGSPEKAELKKKLEEMAGQVVDIPLIIGGEEIRTGNTAQVVMPHDPGHVLANYHKAGPEETQKAIEASQEAHKKWAAFPWLDDDDDPQKAQAILDRFDEVSGGEETDAGSDDGGAGDASGAGGSGGSGGPGHVAPALQKPVNPGAFDGPPGQQPVQRRQCHRHVGKRLRHQPAD